MFNISLEELKKPALKAGLLFSVATALVIFAIILVEQPSFDRGLKPEAYFFIAFYSFVGFTFGASIYSLFLLEKNMVHIGYQRLLIMLQIVSMIIGYIFTNQILGIRFHRFFDDNTFYLACGAVFGPVAITIIYFAGYYIYKWISAGFRSS